MGCLPARRMEAVEKRRGGDVRPDKAGPGKITPAPKGPENTHRFSRRQFVSQIKQVSGWGGLSAGKKMSERSELFFPEERPPHPIARVTPNIPRTRAY